MRVFEAAGYGYENQGLFFNLIGCGKFTVATNGMTVSNAIGGVGSSGATSDLPLATITWNTKFGSIVPNALFQMRQPNAATAVQAQVSAIASDSLAFRAVQILQSQSATASVPGTDATTVTINNTFIRQITGAETAQGTLFLFGYSATGTVTT